MEERAVETTCATIAYIALASGEDDEEEEEDDEEE
jgi:hypothetical protein